MLFFLTSNYAKRSWPPEKGSPQWLSEHQYLCPSLVLKLLPSAANFYYNWDTFVIGSQNPHSVILTRVGSQPHFMNTSVALISLLCAVVPCLGTVLIPWVPPGRPRLPRARRQVGNFWCPSSTKLKAGQDRKCVLPDCSAPTPSQMLLALPSQENVLSPRLTENKFCILALPCSCK